MNVKNYINNISQDYTLLFDRITWSGPCSIKFLPEKNLDKNWKLEFQFLSLPSSFIHQQDTLFTLLLSTQVYEWVPGRMRKFCMFEFARAPLRGCHECKEYSPGSGNCAPSCGIEMNPMTGVIICCEALWALGK